MEKGTGVKEKYRECTFDIDFNPWYVTKKIRFILAINLKIILELSVFLINHHAPPFGA
jgi:hypothetical protein